MIFKNMCLDTGEEIAVYLNPLLKNEFDWHNAVISFLAAIIGGVFAILGVYFANRHNSALAEKEREKQEQTTVISLAEELKVIMECYQDEFRELLATLKEKKYLTITYNISQEYFTVYKNNADKLGLIKNEELRNLFIKIHIELNRLIENFIIYNVQYQSLCERHIAFLTDLNPDLFKIELLKGFDTSPTIKDVQEHPERYMQKNADKDEAVQRIISFYSNNEMEENNLHDKSVELAAIFETIKKLYARIMDIVKEEYRND